MRKFTHLMGLALVALMLLPNVAMAEPEAVYVGNKIASVTAQVGESFTAIFQGIADSPFDHFESLDSAIVFPYEKNMYFASAGQTKLKAVFVGDESQNYTIDITVNPGTPEAFYEYEGATLEQFDLNLTEPFEVQPQAFIIAQKFVADELRFVEDTIYEGVIYSSSDTTVATVDKYGFVTVKALGVTRISAEWSDDNWAYVAASYELNVQKQSIDIYFPDEAYTINYGEEFEAPQVITDPEGLPVIYFSSDTTVATIDSITGEVTILSAGNVDICASFAGNDEYDYNATCYNLDIVEDPDYVFGFEESSSYFLIGSDEEWNAPNLNNPDALAPLVWASSNDTVANVDQFGTVTIFAAGMTVISADFEGDEEHEAAHAEYTLYVEEMQYTLSVLGTQVTAENAADILGDGKVSYDLASNTLTFNNFSFAKELIADDVPVTEGDSVEPSNALVIEDLNEVGQMTTVNFIGKCEFIGTEGFYHARGAQYTGDTLVMTGYTTQINSDQLGLDGIDVTVTGAAKGQPAIRAERLDLYNMSHLLAKNTSEAGYAIEAAYLEMGRNTGIITEGVEFVGADDGYENPYGFFIDSDHTIKATEVELGFVPTPVWLSVCGVPVTFENAEDILGNGKASYDYKTYTLTLDNLSIISDTLTSYPVVEDGEETDDDDYLTINFVGKCEFVNTYGFIHSKFASYTGDTLVCSGPFTQIFTDGLGMNGVNIFATNNSAEEAAMRVGVLYMANNAHLLAKNTNEEGAAIEGTHLFEHEDNLSLLTEGVEFVPVENDDYDAPYGFFIDSDHTILAREVEIGKTTVVIADDVVTTIDFTQTNPDGTEEVVVSLGANDTFNEETGQLEITTTLTDEEVAEALETLIPGSSAFMDALPGSITFDIPAGKGAIDIQCVTMPGYTLNVKIEGQAAISLTQTTFGWAHVEYDVINPVHVVLYLHADEAAPAPARVKANGEPQPALCIQAIVITPENAPLGIEVTNNENSNDGAKKFIYGGQLYILRGNKIYNALGTQIK